MSDKHAALAAMGVRPEMIRGEGGRFEKKKGNQANFAKFCREILEQDEAVEALKEQAKNGVGKDPSQLPPATHKLLCEYGYGLPPRRKENDDEALEKMKALREAARAYITEHPQEARIIDISAMRAAERLPATVKDEDERPAS